MENIYYLENHKTQNNLSSRPRTGSISLCCLLRLASLVMQQGYFYVAGSICLLLFEQNLACIRTPPAGC